MSLSDLSRPSTKPAHATSWSIEGGIVDTLIGFPTEPTKTYAGIRRTLKDRESLDKFEMPAEYMFHDVPSQGGTAVAEAIATTLAEMDRCGISVGLVSLSSNPEVVSQALEQYPDRFVGSWTFDPSEGISGVRHLVEAHARWGLKAASFFPHANSAQVAIDAPLAYLFYAKCVELGLPLFVTVGIAGPRVPSAVQHVERLDQVLYDFPDLVVVMRHGAEPWEDLAVKLMLKWPNLYYSTSGFAPRYYPQAIVDYANTRGVHKILFAGYFPMGLSLERIFSEMPRVPFSEEVWPKFLRENAVSVLSLGEG